MDAPLDAKGLGRGRQGLVSTCLRLAVASLLLLNGQRRKQISGDLNKLTLERFDTISKRLFETVVAVENKEQDVSFLVNELLTRVMQARLL